MAGQARDRGIKTDSTETERLSAHASLGPNSLMGLAPSTPAEKARCRRGLQQPGSKRRVGLLGLAYWESNPVRQSGGRAHCGQAGQKKVKVQVNWVRAEQGGAASGAWVKVSLWALGKGSVDVSTAVGDIVGSVDSDGDTEPSAEGGR